MASVTCLLSSLILTGFIFASMVVDSLPTPSSKCPSFHCDDELTIHYPFWNQTQDSDNCGYPGFNLSCIGKKPMFQFSNRFYHVKNINYSSNSLVLAYNGSNESSCLETGNLVSPSTTTINSIFNYSIGNKILVFFFNCTLFPPSVLHITCLEWNSKRSYVFVEGSIPEFYWHKYCESNLKLPVLDTSVDRDVVQNFGDVLRDGFRLTWKKPDGLCPACEAGGGFCDYTNDQRRKFSCVCTNGRNSTNCNDDTVPIQHEPKTYVAIGGLILGGVVIAAATTFYLVQKRKFATYKPV